MRIHRAKIWLVYAWKIFKIQVRYRYRLVKLLIASRLIHVAFWVSCDAKDAIDDALARKGMEF